MLFRGVLLDGDDRYTIYRIEMKGYTRLDIIAGEAEFQTDTSNLVYGMFKKKIPRVYGDETICKKYTMLKQSLVALMTKTEVSTEWKDGAFYQTILKAQSNDVFMTETTKNGMIDSVTYKFGSLMLTELCIDSTFNLALEPADAARYESMEIEKKVSKTHTIGEYVPLEILRTQYDLSWDALVDYKVVDMSILEEELNKLRALPSDHVTGFDFETSGITFTCEYSDEIVGLVVSYEYDQSRYFPFKHEKFENLPMSVFDELIKILWNKINCAHNKKFERKVLISVGYDKFPLQEDSMLVSIINYPVQRRGAHALKNKEEQLTGRHYLELENIFVDKKKIDFRKLDKEVARIYACPDADGCRKVLDDEKSKMPSYARKIYELEVELADLKAEQEYWGFRVDYEKLMHDYQVCDKVVNMLETLLKKSTNTEININSSIQLSELLYSKLKCPVLVRTKTGKPSVGSKALKKLAKEKRENPSTAIINDIVDSDGNKIIKAEALNKAKFPAVVIMNAYKEYIKLKTAFYARFEKATAGHRYYFWINQNGAESGRQSTPMHQLPKKIKACMLPDSEDHVIVDADYSQVELRILASESGERELVMMMRDSSIDIHRAIASLITGMPMWAISADERQRRKATNFGVVYLISGRGLAEQIFGAGANKEQIKQCTEAIAEFYHHFKRIKRFNNQSREMVIRQGKAFTKFGRVRLFPRVFEEGLPNDILERIVRQATNMPIQGTAADIMKKAEVNLNRMIKAMGWDKLVDTPQGKFPLMRIMISAHDEVLMSTHKSIVSDIPRIYKMVRDCMEMQIEDWAPLFTSCCIVSNWVEGKDDKYAIPIELRDKIIDEGTLRLGDNPKMEMLQIINDFRDKEIAKYIEEVIAKAGTRDPVVIAPLVRHDTLTHDVIARFGPDKKWYEKNGSLSHDDTILFATKNYMEWSEGKLELRHDDGIRAEETDLEEAIRESVALTSELYNFDEKGNLIDMSGEMVDEPEEEYEVISDEDIAEYKAVYLDPSMSVVFEMFNMFIVDCHGLKQNQCDELLKLLSQFQVDDGFSSIKIMYNEQLIDTGLRCEKIDRDIIFNWIIERKKENTDELQLVQKPYR